jgi:hypothetical protein
MPRQRITLRDSQIKRWARLDSNQGPTDYEPVPPPRLPHFRALHLRRGTAQPLAGGYSSRDELGARDARAGGEGSAVLEAGNRRDFGEKDREAAFDEAADPAGSAALQDNDERHAVAEVAELLAQEALKAVGLED